MAGDLYALLGLSSRQATEKEVKRAYRNLATRVHPDKGGDPTHFKRILTAYEVLSDPGKRGEYDATGKITKSIEEDFADAFGGGTFRDRGLNTEQAAETIDISERITVFKDDTQSHTAGFEAWMRSRGDSATEILTAESMADKFGVQHGSYESVALPGDTDVQQVMCKEGGQPADVLKLAAGRLPPALEWGEVLVNLRFAAINPADIYTAKMGGVYGSSKVAVPYLAGHDGLGVVVKVGAGVRDLKEGDRVMPLKSHMGTWRNLAVWKAKDLLHLRSDMPLEYGAMLREMFLAYRLLEDHGKLKPGDCVILNAANSSTGQVIIQLCKILRLRVVAVVRQPDKVGHWLRELGASVVISDTASIKTELESMKFFSKPKLALDAVGGSAAARLTDALIQGGTTVCYGCLGGKSPAWPWQSWVFKEQQVSGFNLRAWLLHKTRKVPHMLDALTKLVNAGLKIAYTDYELQEFSEALDHALDDAKNTKVLLRMPEWTAER